MIGLQRFLLRRLKPSDVLGSPFQGLSCFIVAEVETSDESGSSFQDFISHYRKTTIFHKDTSTFKEFSYFCALKSKIRRSPERTTISQAGVQPSPSPVGAKTLNSTIMGSSLAKNDIHIVFHIKYHSMELRDEDLGHVFAYIGGFINYLG